jgi:uncharacterized damage-inducible protein DinB
MNQHSDNTFLDRLLRHMAWANHRALTELTSLPSNALKLHAPNDPDWTVIEIAQHLVGAASFYCRRLGSDVALFESPASVDSAAQGDVSQLPIACAGYDALLRELAAAPDASTTFNPRDGVVVHRARSTIVAQAIHHATEHRTQIAGVLSAHGIAAIDLDSLDLWSFGDAEGLGD